MRYFLREAWTEFVTGLRSGVLPLIHLALTGYILMIMTSADSLRSMAAVDVPRNAPSLVYLMTSGMAFFLFFAWAWVFAQAVVRDRHAQLQEIILSAPRPLRQMLLARYVGALGVALVVGSSQVIGFLLAPLMEAIGTIPAGSTGPAPWAALAWAWLIFTLPLALGSGALYFAATLRWRGVGAAFAVSALLMACWMLAMTVLKDAHIDPFVTALFDPSGFAEAQRQVVDHWTPEQKRSALIALTPGFLLGRLIWCGLPLVLLAVSLWRCRRESLLHATPRRPAILRPALSAAQTRPVSICQPDGKPGDAWLRAAWDECRWQAGLLLRRRSLWLALALLVLLASAAGFVHGVQHGYGPMQARAEFISPVLVRHFYLIIVFLCAAMVGLAARRDQQPGLQEMFDAAPAPAAVRVIGRAVAAALAATLCVLIPALAALLVGALTGARSDLLLPLSHQLLVLLPAILELAATCLLLHTLIRPAGVAHAASMLAAFVMVVNFEVGLVNYPPYQIGRGVDITLSGLTGLAAWRDKLLLGDLFKLALVLALVALATGLTRRGLDRGWRSSVAQLRCGLAAWPGVIAMVAMLIMAITAHALWQGFVEQGGYQTLPQRLASDARWERRWQQEAATGFSVAGGEVALLVRPQHRDLQGRWRIDGLQLAGEHLHAQLPTGFALISARRDGHDIAATVTDDHLVLALPECRQRACTVELQWQVSAQGWTVADEGIQARPAWLVGDAFWIRARDVLPRLGLDGERVLRDPAERVRQGLAATLALPGYTASLASGAAAPGGQWKWEVRLQSADTTSLPISQASRQGVLDFAAFHAPQARQSHLADAPLLTHDRWRGVDATMVAQDLKQMSRCVGRRLGQAPAIDGVVQWPRGLPPGDADAAVAGNLLLLAEQAHWDVAPQGNGRLIRRAEIAAALARRLVIDQADLREGVGSRWLDQGVAGAIGLLCVAEQDGLPALQMLLARGAQRITEALAGAPEPVTDLASARRRGWAEEYVPLAALATVARWTAQDQQALLQEVRRQRDVTAALVTLQGAPLARLWMGAPNTVDLRVGPGGVEGQRWRWQAGDWRLQADAPQPLRLQRSGDTLHWDSDTDATPTPTPALFLDDWSAYEREPRDNWGATRR
ncbi:hypothetical protein HBH1_01656 [Herbaspirillum sp. BH-1]|uniref:ABC transporter permease n=1 Tax=Herbaspirillum frisingense TaxID=92645 RepID=A0ABU1PB51_9BURK|nr:MULTISPECIES: ABC transporter permease [Herbaspirillum]MDR6582568.1 hypothetical protein [Herbaspirillum frisingense]PLY59729.1 hypothetical protein HBH1_01656 [Herbaspirillum sp. BH-1]